MTRRAELGNRRRALRQGWQSVGPKVWFSNQAKPIKRMAYIMFVQAAALSGITARCPPWNHMIMR